MFGRSARELRSGVKLLAAGCALLQLVAADVSVGMFSYPAPGSALTFNYIDSVNVSWNVFSDNITDPYLVLWLTQSLEPFKQTLVFNQSVKDISSLVVPLNYGQSWNDSNFNIQQGPTPSPDQPFFVSGKFDITKTSNKRAIIWNLNSAASPSGTVPSDASSTSDSSSTPSSTSSTDHHNSATIPVLATFFTLFALATIILTLLFLRHRNRLRALETYIQSPPPPFPGQPAMTTHPSRLPFHGTKHQEMPGFGPGPLSHPSSNTLSHPSSQTQPHTRSHTRRWLTALKPPFKPKPPFSPSSAPTSTTWSAWLSTHGASAPRELHVSGPAHADSYTSRTESVGSASTGRAGSPRWYGRDGIMRDGIMRDGYERDGGREYERGLDLGLSGSAGKEYSVEEGMVSPVAGRADPYALVREDRAAMRELQGVFLGHELPERTTPAPPQGRSVRGSVGSGVGSRVGSRERGEEEERRERRVSLGRQSRRDSRGAVTQVLAPVALGPVPGRSGGRRTPLERGLL